MTEYWKSVGNYYCDYCKLYVRNDAFNRRQHEASPRHQGALKRQVRDIHRKSEREAREALYVKKELARIGGKVAEPSLTASEVPKPINIGTRPKKTQQPETLDDAEVSRLALAAQAIPGQWSSVSTAEDEASTVKEAFDDEAEEDEKKPDMDLLEPQLIELSQKRRRDGADEDLLNFKVEAKKLALPVDDDASTPSVSFKKKKNKTAKQTIKTEES